MDLRSTHSHRPETRKHAEGYCADDFILLLANQSFVIDTAIDTGDH